MDSEALRVLKGDVRTEVLVQRGKQESPGLILRQVIRSRKGLLIPVVIAEPGHDAAQPLPVLKPPFPEITAEDCIADV